MAPPPRAQNRVGPCRPLLHQAPLTIENLPRRIQNGDCIVLPPKFNPPICQPQSACNPCQPPCTPCCPPYCYPCYPPCPPPCPVQVVCAPGCGPCSPCMPCTPCTPCMPSPPPPPCCPPPPCPPPACQPCVPQSCCGGGTGCCCSPRKQIVCVPRKAQQLTGGTVGTMSPCSGGDTKSQGSKGLPGLGDQPASYNNCNFYLSDAPKSMRDKFGKARSARSDICQEDEEDECEEESEECVEDEECLEDDECEEDMNIAAGDDQIMNPPVGYPGSTRTPWGGRFPGLGKGFPGTGRDLNGSRRASGGGSNSVGGRNSGGTRSSRGSRAASQGGIRDQYGKSRQGTAINGRQTVSRHGSNGSGASYGRTGGLNSHGRLGPQSTNGKNGGRDPYGTMGTYGSRDPSGTRGTNGSQGRSGMGPGGSRYTANTSQGGNPSGRGGTGADMYGGQPRFTGRGGGGGGANGKQSHLNDQSSANKSRYKSGASASILSKSAGYREYLYGNEELIKKSEAYLPEMYDIVEHPSNQSSTSKFVHPSRAPLPTSTIGTGSCRPSASHRSTQKYMPRSHDFGHTTAYCTQSRYTMKPSRTTMTPTHNAWTQPSRSNMQSNRGTSARSPPRTVTAGYSTRPHSSHQNSRGNPTNYSSQRTNPSHYPSHGSEAALSQSYTEPPLTGVLEENSIPASRSSTQTRLEIFDRPNQPSEIRVTQRPVQISRSETNARTHDSTYGQSGTNLRRTKSLEDSQARSFYGPDDVNYNDTTISGYNPRGNNSGINSPSQSRNNMDSYSKEDFEGGNQYGGGSNRRKPKTCIKYHTRRLHRLCSISNQRQKRLSQIHKPIFSIRNPECPVRETHASILRKKPPATCTGHEQKVPQFHEYCMTDHKPDTNRYPLLTREFSPNRQHEYESDPNTNTASGFEKRGAKRKQHHR